MSHEAIIATIQCAIHPNANNLQIGSVNGFTVIVSNTTKSGDVGIFFMADSQLDHQFCLRNKLYRKHPETGEVMGGYLEANRRVRTIRLRSINSEGLWLPLSSLDYMNHNLKVGDLVGELNGAIISQKYYPPATLRAMGNRDKKAIKEVEFPFFSKHYETSQLRFVIDTIPRGAHIILTEKLHGTSARSGKHLRVKQRLPWLKKIGIDLTKKYYDSVYGSRNVTFTEESQIVSANNYTKDHLLDFNYRLAHHKLFNCINGETFYYEIVGYENDVRPIMTAHDLSGSDEIKKELKNRFNKDKMIYSYGCRPGQSKIFVYRITYKIDGHEIDLSWNQVVKRCLALGIPTVPLIDSFIYFGDKDQILNKCREFKYSLLSHDHIPEGVCVKIEHPSMEKIVKYKTFEFCHLEGIQKQDDDFIDKEDIS